MSEPNWAELWRELAERVRRPEREVSGIGSGEARGPDALLEFMLGKLRPGDTLLDIGAGNGRYAIPFARVVTEVTAIEPVASRAAVLRETGIRVIEARWEEADVPSHDIAFCSHAMYTSPDLVQFVRKMERHARKLCFLVMRMPSHDGVLRELSEAIYGQPHDSPNFWVGYHVLYDMGIYANAVVEPALRPWTDDSLESALQRARRHLRLDDERHDDRIRETLRRRLVPAGGQYRWPDGMRSAVAWWQPSRE